MRRFVLLALAFAVTGAWAQERYTNADLDRIYVPGAFTNEDLKALPRIETQAKPAQPLVAPRIDTSERDLLWQHVRALEQRRTMLTRELTYEEELVREAEGPGGNSPDRAPYLGYRSKSRSRRHYLRKQIALLDATIEDARWHAVRASIVSFR